MFEVSVKTDFAAAHFLRGYEGKCKNLHGHTWNVELVFQGEQLDSLGLLVDFALVKKNLKEFLEILDHRYLNELPYFQNLNPTTEHLAKYIFDEFSKHHFPARLSKVTVWESDHSCATYYP